MFIKENKCQNILLITGCQPTIGIDANFEKAIEKLAPISMIFNKMIIHESNILNLCCEIFNYETVSLSFSDVNIKRVNLEIPDKL